MDTNDTLCRSAHLLKGGHTHKRKHTPRISPAEAAQNKQKYKHKQSTYGPTERPKDTHRHIPAFVAYDSLVQPCATTPRPSQTEPDRARPSQTEPDRARPSPIQHTHIARFFSSTCFRVNANAPQQTHTNNSPTAPHTCDDAQTDTSQAQPHSGPFVRTTST